MPKYTYKNPFTKEEYDNLDDVAYDIVVKMIKDLSVFFGVIPDDDYILTPEWVDELDMNTEKRLKFTKEHWMSNREMFALFDFIKTDKSGITKREAMKVFIETITNKQWLEKIGRLMC